MRKAVRKLLADSRVSDLLKDGYESRLGPDPVGVCEPGVLFPSFSLDGELPILTISDRLFLFAARDSCLAGYLYL